MNSNFSNRIHALIFIHCIVRSFFLCVFSTSNFLLLSLTAFGNFVFWPFFLWVPSYIEKRVYFVWASVSVSYVYHVLRFLYKRWDFIQRFYGIRRLCAAYSHDAFFFYGREFSYSVSSFWRRRCKIPFYVPVPCGKSWISGNAAGCFV